MGADIVVKPQIGARGIDLGVPAPQLGHSDAIARCNSITLIPRLDHVETITVSGDPGHRRVDARGGCRFGGRGRDGGRLGA